MSLKKFLLTNKTIIEREACCTLLQAVTYVVTIYTPPPEQMLPILIEAMDTRLREDDPQCVNDKVNDLLSQLRQKLRDLSSPGRETPSSVEYWMDEDVEGEV